MFWPVLLPRAVAFCLLAAIVALFTLFSPAFHWNRGRTLFVGTLLATLAFIPTCFVTMAVVNSLRFGVFQYDDIGDVGDYRVERYLPTKANSITVEKYAQGHRAKYSISENELTGFLDGLWDKNGGYSPRSRDELEEGTIATAEEFDHEFGELGWPSLDGTIKYFSPFRSNWAGATYFYDRNTGIAYHRAGYW